MTIEQAKNVFFVGIGGIGVSGLARLFRANGKTVSGSNLEANEITESLQKEGIEVFLGHKGENIPLSCDLLVFSGAVPENNPERMEGKKRGIVELPYPEALSAFMAGKTVIAVAGTNGKTTTSAMVATMLEDLGFDPTAIIGSVVNRWQSNARAGKSKYFVVEADEYRRAFLNYPADIAVITNIAPDHLDYYHDLPDIENAFTEFASKIKPGGTLIFNQDDSSTAKVASRAARRISFGFKKISDFNPERFDVELSLPGKYNKANALAALAAVSCVPDVSLDKALGSLKKFTGTWRRFERVGESAGGAAIISDYAHHPDGIRVTLEAASEIVPPDKILAIFQPHQHNRTKTLFREFVQAFCVSKVSNLILAEIFDVAGREASGDQDISSKDLVVELKKCKKNAIYAANLDETLKLAKEKQNDYQMILIMGAGDIYKIASLLVGN